MWDYTRTKVAYYKDYAENMGVPQGLGKLSKREMKAREFSYRFESKGYKVRRVTRVNSVDKLFELSSGNMEWLRPNDFQLYYLDNGKVDYVEVLDRNHNVLCKKDYNDKLNVVTLRHNDELGTEMCISTNVENDPFSTNSDDKSYISSYLLSYVDDGFIETILFDLFK